VQKVSAQIQRGSCHVCIYGR